MAEFNTDAHGFEIDFTVEELMACPDIQQAVPDWVQRNTVCLMPFVSGNDTDAVYPTPASDPDVRAFRASLPA